MTDTFTSRWLTIPETPKQGTDVTDKRSSGLQQTSEAHTDKAAKGPSVSNVSEPVQPAAKKHAVVWPTPCTNSTCTCSDPATTLRALIQQHGRLRLHAGWPYGWASTPDPEVAIHLVNTYPGGFIETTAGKKVATWVNEPTDDRHSTGTPTDSGPVQDSGPEALTHSTLAGDAPNNG